MNWTQTTNQQTNKVTKQTEASNRSNNQKPEEIVTTNRDNIMGNNHYFTRYFCQGESILDFDQLWYTNVPQFNACFRHTLPVWIPTAFLLVFAPIEVMHTIVSHRHGCRRRHHANSFVSIKPNCFNTSRITLVTLLLVLHLIHFCLDLNTFLVIANQLDVIFSDSDTGLNGVAMPSLAELFAQLLHVFTFATLTFLFHFHRKHGLHTSGTAWFFTLFNFILTLPTAYTYLTYYLQDSLPHSWNPNVEFILFGSHFILSFLLFILTSIADHQSSIEEVEEEEEDEEHTALDQQTALLKCDDNNDDDDEKSANVPTVGHSHSYNEKLKINPELQASFPSLLTFWWFNSLTWLGFCRVLTLNDLWALNPADSTKVIAEKFDQNWTGGDDMQIEDNIEENDKESKEEEFEANNASYGTFVRKQNKNKPNTKISDHHKSNKANIVMILIHTFGAPYFVGSLCRLALDLIQFVNPQLLKIFITFISTSTIDEPTWHGYAIAAAFFTTSTVETLLRITSDCYLYRVGMNVRTALISRIYRQSIHISADVKRSTTTGEIVNLMSTDVEHIADLMPDFVLFWSSPLQIALALYFLWNELGASVLAGFTLMLLLVPFNAITSTALQKFSTKQMVLKDERVKVMNEMFNAMRVIKLYAWEISFMQRITGIRCREVKQIRNVAYLGAVVSIFWFCTPLLVTLVTFGVYVLSSTENVLTPQKMFVSLTLFELLRFPLTYIPELIAKLMMAIVSVKRLNAFLNASHLQEYVRRRRRRRRKNNVVGDGDDNGNGDDNDNDDNEKVVVSIRDGTFCWNQNDNDNDQPTLKSINLKIKKGSLVAIVGQVGSGKSSLLSAILGDMYRLSGEVTVNTTTTTTTTTPVAYVAQQAFIRNATLQENILFGSPYDASRYREVVELCALASDISILPGGDQTEIGEKGINLSGGQKQRLSIARACYSNASLILLDDPLSAVDAHVAKSIFDQVLSSQTGFLRNRTRVLVTNDVSNLKQMDQIVILSNGTITEMGTFDELMSSGEQSNQLKRFFDEYRVKLSQQSSSSSSSSSSSMSNQQEDDGNEIIEHQKVSLISKASKHQDDNDDENVDGNGNEDDNDDDYINHSGGRLIEVEHTKTGGVKLSLYITYFRSMTCHWFCLAIIGFAVTEVISIGSDVWLAAWSNDVVTTTLSLNSSSSSDPFDTSTTAQRNYRLTIYALFGLAQAVLIFCGTFSLASGSVQSSIRLHHRLLERILHSPMVFFDTTPIGRILNRFSKDFDMIDSTISFEIDNFMTILFQLISNFVLITVQIPLFVLVLFPIGIAYIVIQKFYIPTSRQLNRLESITRSPIFSHFNETLTGVTTIRAYNRIQTFVAESNAHVDHFQRCFFPGVISRRWLALRMEFFGNLIVLFVALFAVRSRDSFLTEPGIVGLILTYALGVTQSLNLMVRSSAEMEKNFIAVERIVEYCNVESEREWTRPRNVDPTIPSDWPNRGEIDLINYGVRYRDELDLVLNNVTLHINSNEKIGIVGRTGAGKSSLTLALFRLLEPTFGKIVIDNIDTGRIGLHELRSKLTIIPQDPILFSGTIRSNLDPFQIANESNLWRALEQAHLHTYVRALSGGLDHVVAENGANFSVGQRQLFCLARALLRHTRILILDEATAAVDIETDTLIHDTIRREFNNTVTTVLTIAHRLHTILDSDRVLVLDHGRVVEFDTPATLLSNRNSQFYSLANDAATEEEEEEVKQNSSLDAFSSRIVNIFSLPKSTIEPEYSITITTNSSTAPPPATTTSSTTTTTSTTPTTIESKILTETLDSATNVEQKILSETLDQTTIGSIILMKTFEEVLAQETVEPEFWTETAITPITIETKLYTDDIESTETSKNSDINELSSTQQNTLSPQTNDPSTNESSTTTTTTDVNKRIDTIDSTTENIIINDNKGGDGDDGGKSGSMSWFKRFFLHSLCILVIVFLVKKFSGFF